MREDRVKYQTLLDSPDLFAAETPSAPLEPNFRNRTVWTGDNLFVLRGMNSACVDLVYLDPPFNSNRTYSAPIGSEAAGAAFKDAWTKDELDVGWHGEIADREPALHAVLRAAELAHGTSLFAYLVMMGIRLLELRRILKPTGSLYLHCDPTASHWLKAVLDALFGPAQFRNEIIWRRTKGRSDANRFGRVHDTLLYYVGRDGGIWNPVYLDHDPKYVERAYRYRDPELGCWRAGDLTASGTTEGESGAPWRDIDPGQVGRHWATPSKGGMNDFIIDNELIPGWPDAYPSVHARLDALDAAGLLHWPAKDDGMPSLKRFLASTKGNALEDVITDVKRLEHQSKEGVGYPTQKPLALLDRLIRASSDEGDLVLDPFCGCATTCIAAELAGRRWAGIDLSKMAVHLLSKRLKDHADREGALFRRFAPIVRTDLPRRTDINDPTLIGARSDKHVLYGQQEGRCNGCRVHFPFRNLTVDHVVPRAHGGHDGIDNKQLLCAACNSMKGTRTQQALVAKLKADGILA